MRLQRAAAAGRHVSRLEAGFRACEDTERSATRHAPFFRSGSSVADGGRTFGDSGVGGWLARFLVGGRSAGRH